MPTDRLADVVEALPAGWQAHYLDVTDSTQDDARAAAERGAPGRSIFVADYQRAGRGRQGRTWVAAPGTALMLSMLFRERAGPPVPWRWTSLASVALVDAIEGIAPSAQLAIKWPNDVMLAERKLAGILAQTTWDGQELVAVVGVGVNVSTPARDLAALGMATSLKVATGQDIDRVELLSAFVARLDAWLTRPTSELVSAWQARLWGRGQRLRLVEFGHDAEDVVVVGAEPDGSLRVRLADGTERRTTTGELIL